MEVDIIGEESTFKALVDGSDVGYGCKGKTFLSLLSLLLLRLLRLLLGMLLT